jgi:DNA processing protein
LTDVMGVAICISPVTSRSTLQADQLPRLAAVGWRHVLHVCGDLAERPSVAIVGARAASRTAMDRAFALASHLAGRGITVVSGGAIGVDAAAHRGALAGGGRTTVVLGSGVDVAYPLRNASLFAAVVDGGGALVSMFPVGTQPRRENFPRRNRLIAALADHTVVIEAAARSGSLSTARAARELGRPVGACGGSAGCDRLLADGAALVDTTDDLDALIAGTPRRRVIDTAGLDDSARRVADALARGVRGVDAVALATGLGVRDVLRAISSIERSGFAGPRSNAQRCGELIEARVP